RRDTRGPMRKPGPCSRQLRSSDGARGARTGHHPRSQRLAHSSQLTPLGVTLGTEPAWYWTFATHCGEAAASLSGLGPLPRCQTLAELTLFLLGQRRRDERPL